MEATSLPVLDRHSLEKLFGVGRRQAVRIMSALGGYQAGRTFLIEREQLVRCLGRIAAGADAERSIRRRQRIWQVLRREMPRLRAPNVRIAPAAVPPRLTNLPEGVDLSPGRLVVTFAHPIELLERLYALAQALAVDYENFEKSVEEAPPAIVPQ